MRRRVLLRLMRLVAMEAEAVSEDLVRVEDPAAVEDEDMSRRSLSSEPAAKLLLGMSIRRGANRSLLTNFIITLDWRLIAAILFINSILISQSSSFFLNLRTLSGVVGLA